MCILYLYFICTLNMKYIWSTYEVYRRCILLVFFIFLILYWYWNFISSSSPVSHAEDIIGLLLTRAPGQRPDGARPLDPHLLVSGLAPDRHEAVAEAEGDELSSTFGNLSRLSAVLRRTKLERLSLAWILRIVESRVRIHHTSFSL